MPDSKFFNIPFGTSGDRTIIPEVSQSSGAVSYQQGWTPDYERNPANDPLAKRIPRNETNDFYYQVTNAIKYLQLFGVPEYTTAVDGGPANYPLNARVRNGNMVYVSIVAANTAVPGTDAAKWALDEVFSIAALEATQAEMTAGDSGAKIGTPRRVATSVQRGDWRYTGEVGGTVSTFTSSLTPTLPAYVEGMVVYVKVRVTNTGPCTLRIGSLANLPIVRADGSPLQRSDLIVGQIVELVCTGTSFQVAGLKTIDLPSRNLWSKTTAGSGTFVIPAGVFKVFARIIGGGGGAAGVGQWSDGAAKCSGGGGAGGYAEKWIDVVPGQTVTLSVGAGGVGGAASPNNVNNNGSPGTNGGTTTLTVNGTTISATGGEQGFGGVNVSGGFGGVGSGGDLNFAGGFGTDGAPVNGVYGGNGGAGAFGGGGRSGTSGGFSGVSPGSGGGAHYGYWAANGKGGNGADGFVLIQY